jgi:short-subunit dehydrogenase involved in D-alanine esterification of teichoic acids
LRCLQTEQQYSQEINFDNWCVRLQIYQLDLRDLARVEAFTGYLDRTYPHLDIIINNAAQTIRRPPAYYGHLDLYQQKIETIPDKFGNLTDLVKLKIDMI